MKTQQSGRLTSLCGMLGGFILLATTSAQALLIDDFSDMQILHRSSTGTSTNTVAAPNALGGYRDAKVNVTATGGLALALDIAIGGGDEVLNHSQGAKVKGSSTIQWDGDSGSPFLKTTGLGGVDLTEGGINHYISFDVLYDDLPATLKFTIYDMSGHTADASVVLPGGIDSSTSYKLFFSSFTGVNPLLNLTSVGAITMKISGSLSPDLTIDNIQATAAPEPGTFLLLGTGLLGIGGYGWRRKRQVVQA